MGDILKFEKKRECQIISVRGNGENEVMALDTEFLRKSKPFEISAIMSIVAVEYDVEFEYYSLEEIYPSNSNYFYIDSMDSLSSYFYD